MWKVNGRQTTDAKWWQKLMLPLARWAKKWKIKRTWQQRPQDRKNKTKTQHICVGHHYSHSRKIKNTILNYHNYYLPCTRNCYVKLFFFISDVFFPCIISLCFIGLLFATIILTETVIFKDDVNMLTSELIKDLF